VKPRIPPALALVVAVFAISWSGPLVRFTDAPPLAVAAWRLCLSVVILLLFLAVPSNREYKRFTPKQALLAVCAGVFLAGHFATWITSLRYTSVANSVTLVSMQPLFAAFMSTVFLREKPSGRQWLGIVVAAAGAIIIGATGGAAGSDHLKGDLLAVSGAAFGAAYFLIGRVLRGSVGLWQYTTTVYGVSAVALVITAVLSRVPLGGYAGGDWLVFIALAAVPMMLGHTGINYALRYVPAYIANIVVLGEPIGATLIAWLLPAIAEVPTPRFMTGAVLVLAGIVLSAETRAVKKRVAVPAMETPGAGD